MTYNMVGIAILLMIGGLVLLHATFDALSDGKRWSFIVGLLTSCMLTSTSIVILALEYTVR